MGTIKEGIHKGCLHLVGGRGIATTRTKSDRGGDLAVSGHPFRCVSVGERQFYLYYLKVILSSTSSFKE